MVLNNAEPAVELGDDEDDADGTFDPRLGGDESSDDDDHLPVRVVEVPPPTASEDVMQRVLESMRLNGCGCTGFSDTNQRQPEQQQDGMSLTEMVAFRQDKCGLTDVMGDVAIYGQLGTVPEAAMQVVPWANLRLERRQDKDALFVPLRSLGASRLAFTTRTPVFLAACRAGVPRLEVPHRQHEVPLPIPRPICVGHD